MSSLIKISKGAIYKEIYDLRADESKRTKYGVVEMIIDFHENSSYYKTLCLIDGKIRNPLYNGDHNKYEAASIDEYIEQLGQLCGKHTEIHEEAKRDLDRNVDNISIVREYANNCINVINIKFDLFVYAEYAKQIEKRLNTITNKIDINSYNELITEIDEVLKSKVYDNVIDIYKHNSENPKIQKRYPDLKKDYALLCEYAFYQPVINNVSYTSFVSLREKTKDKIEEEMDEIRSQFIKDEYDSIVNNFKAILDILKDK